MDKINHEIQFLIGAVGGVAGGYATLKLGLMGLAHMSKDQQKIREARDGMTNVVIGLIIALSAAAIVAWLKTP